MKNDMKALVKEAKEFLDNAKWFLPLLVWYLFWQFGQGYIKHINAFAAGLFFYSAMDILISLLTNDRSGQSRLRTILGISFLLVSFIFFILSMLYLGSLN